MPTAADRRRLGRPLLTAALLTATVTLAFAGCGRIAPPMSPTTPSPSDMASPSPGDSDSASAGLTPDPADTASPGGTASPDETAAPAGSPTSGGSVAPANCTSVSPIRVERAAVEPRRTTEVVTVVSDGRNLTPGTREQTDFVDPVLTAPDAVTTVTDRATLTKVADLIEGSSKNTVLLERSDPPDTGADTNQRPFNATGTYVLYNASGLLSADVIVACSDQEQRWRFIAEADNTVGTVNCAVEPPRGNAVARQVFGSFC